MTEDEAKALACALNNARSGSTYSAGDELYFKIVSGVLKFAQANSRISRIAFLSYAGVPLIYWQEFK